MSNIEHIFKSPACINGSFLLDNNAHSGCSSRNPGVSIENATQAFDMFRKMENKTLKQIVITPNLTRVVRSICMFLIRFSIFHIPDLGRYHTRFDKIVETVAVRCGSAAPLSHPARLPWICEFKELRQTALPLLPSRYEPHRYAIENSIELVGERIEWLLRTVGGQYQGCRYTYHNDWI